MKIRFQRLNHVSEFRFTTVGYWYWSGASNTGTLKIQVLRMSSRRFEVAVCGHEIIEALYCWMMGITTEECDAFDEKYEQAYKEGKIKASEEPGDDPDCPYHIGHRFGVAWEHACIALTRASWQQYCAECDKLMGINI